jgi:hypothetical protein
VQPTQLRSPWTFLAKLIQVGTRILPKTSNFGSDNPTRISGQSQHSGDERYLQRQSPGQAGRHSELKKRSPQRNRTGNPHVHLQAPDDSTDEICRELSRIRSFEDGWNDQKDYRRAGTDPQGYRK